MSYVPYKQPTSFSVSDILSPADECGFRQTLLGGSVSSLYDPSASARSNLHPATGAIMHDQSAGPGNSTLQVPNPYHSYLSPTSYDMAQYASGGDACLQGLRASGSTWYSSDAADQRLASECLSIRHRSLLKIFTCKKCSILSRCIKNFQKCC